MFALVCIDVQLGQRNPPCFEVQSPICVNVYNPEQKVFALANVHFDSLYIYSLLSVHLLNPDVQIMEINK